MSTPQQYPPPDDADERPTVHRAETAYPGTPAGTAEPFAPSMDPDEARGVVGNRAEDAAADADLARGLSEESWGRAEEHAGRGDVPAAEAATKDAVELASVAAEFDAEAGRAMSPRAQAATSYSVTAPDGPAPAQSAGAGPRPTEAPRQAQTVKQAPSPRR